MSEPTSTWGTNTDDYEISNTKVEFLISNLVALGILKWETEVDVDAAKSTEDPNDPEIDVDVIVDGSTSFIFSRLGLKFLEICKAS